jgi:hypothetical protein
MGPIETFIDTSIERSIYTYVSLFPAIPENLKAMPSQEQWAHPDPDLVC